MITPTRYARRIQATCIRLVALTGFTLLSACGGFSADRDDKTSLSPKTPTGTKLAPVILTPIETLNIADPALSKCIRNTRRLYIEDITALTCNNQGVQSVEGIEQLSALKTLFLSFNQIEDIDPLASLSSLSTLYLAGNQIDNIDALAELFELQVLSIQNNAIYEVSALRGLTKLAKLYSGDNQITDFTILADLNLAILAGTERQG